jgi:hypothetical protein
MSNLSNRNEPGDYFTAWLTEVRRPPNLRIVRRPDSRSLGIGHFKDMIQLDDANKPRARFAACVLISGIAMVSHSAPFNNGPIAKTPPKTAPSLLMKAPSLVVSIPRNNGP